MWRWLPEIFLPATYPFRSARGEGSDEVWVFYSSYGGRFHALWAGGSAGRIVPMNSGYAYCFPSSTDRHVYYMKSGSEAPPMLSWP